MGGRRRRLAQSSGQPLRRRGRCAPACAADGARAGGAAGARYRCVDPFLARLRAVAGAALHGGHAGSAGPCVQRPATRSAGIVTARHGGDPGGDAAPTRCRAVPGRRSFGRGRDPDQDGTRWHHRAAWRRQPERRAVTAPGVRGTVLLSGCEAAGAEFGCAATVRVARRAARRHRPRSARDGIGPRSARHRALSAAWRAVRRMCKARWR